MSTQGAQTRTLAQKFYRTDAFNGEKSWCDLTYEEQMPYEVRAEAALLAAKTIEVVPARFRAMEDGDDARDLLADYRQDVKDGLIKEEL